MTTIQTRAGRVAYHESGSGPTVLLLHATLHDRHDFDPIVEALAEHYCTIAVDWPGHGDSDPVEATVQPSAPLFADVLEDVDLDGPSPDEHRGADSWPGEYQWQSGRNDGRADEMSCPHAL